jgi:signal transduction histidine kinase
MAENRPTAALPDRAAADTAGPAPPEVASRAMRGREFLRRFRWLVFHTWNIPPIFGLGFILLVGVLTPQQVLGILVTPLEPAYILGWLAFSLWYLPRRVEPIAAWLDGEPGADAEAAWRAVRRFPFVFWGLFLVYLVLAPVSVVVAAEIYTDFVARPVDLFRIELIALIVSIIVGLPIFFRIFDLFGRAVGGLERRPVFRVRTKVFVIGALVPLLIDTMLVQYYWTRTGYFTLETLGVWFLLEVIAIGGSLVFASSFGQALAPLRALLEAPRPLPPGIVQALSPASTDELGALTRDYNRLLRDLQRHHENLEQAVRQRTAELESAVGELEAFAYSVSHDLRAPLRAIDGFSRILEEDHLGHLDDQARGHFERVRGAVRRMDRLIDSILSLSRVSRAGMTRQAVDLGALAADIVADLRASEPARKVDVTIAPGLTAQGDPHLCAVALGNLIGNAWKYTARKAGAAIEIGADGAGPRRTFHVRDNGTGFDMRYADKLFRAFHRLHGDEYPGDGIGLATAARIVQRHGGRIWAEAEPGRGATFFFTLEGASG